MPDAIPERAVDTVDLGGVADHDLSMMGLFLQADLVVKTVMLMLVVLFSVVLGYYFRKTLDLEQTQKAGQTV